MQIQLTGHKMDITPALREFAQDKLEKLTKFHDRITQIHVTFDVEKLRQIAEATLHIPGSECHARAESENMYKTIDQLIDKLVKQLRRHKEKVGGHRD